MTNAADGSGVLEPVPAILSIAGLCAITLALHGQRVLLLMTLPTFPCEDAVLVLIGTGFLHPPDTVP